MIDVTDDPPGEHPGEALPGAPETPSGAPAGARDGEAPATPGEAPQRRRRRRRRRKGPRPPGEGQAAAPPGEARPEGAALAAADGAAAPAPGEAPPPGSAPQHPPRRHRSRPRRHRGPRPQGAPPAAPTEGTPAEGHAKPEEAPRAPYRRGVRERDFRAERRTAADASPAAPGATEERGRNRGPRRGGERPPGERGGERSSDRGGGGGGGRERGRGGDRPRHGKGKGPPDRGFGARAAKPEPKLYSTEALVDRGFEDVPNPENEAETQRVHWTIVKRTVADQRTTKPVSMLYILKRGDSEAEFANLSLARAAVNKTIVHPEKLTLSKEQHDLARGKK